MNRAEQESTARIHLDELRGLLGVMAPSEHQPITARTCIAEVEAELARERAVTLSEPVRIASAPRRTRTGTRCRALPSSRGFHPRTSRRCCRRRHDRCAVARSIRPNVVRIEKHGQGSQPSMKDRRRSRGNRELEPSMREAVAMLPLQPPPIEADVPSMPQPRHLDIEAAVEPPTGSLRYAELAAYFVISSSSGSAPSTASRSGRLRRMAITLCVTRSRARLASCGRSKEVGRPYELKFVDILRRASRRPDGRRRAEPDGQDARCCSTAMPSSPGRGDRAVPRGCATRPAGSHRRTRRSRGGELRSALDAVHAVRDRAGLDGEDERLGVQAGTGRVGRAQRC